jgi:hypothetical protein
MNPLWLWGLGAAALAAFAGAGAAPPAAAARPPPPPPRTKAPPSFTRQNIDQAIAIAMQHERSPQNLASFGAALMAYGWSSQGAALQARAAQVEAETITANAKKIAAAHPTHHAPAHHAPAPHVVHRSYTKAELQSLIAQTQSDLTAHGGFSAPTGAQKKELQAELAHYKTLLAKIVGHH